MKLYTVEPLIAATFTAKVRWPLLGGGRYSEVAAIRGSTVCYFVILLFCFFVTCLNNLVSNLSYEYKNADLALLSSKLKLKSITCRYTK